MELRSADGSELHLSIKGYEAPQIAHDPYDSNWLMVTIRTKTNRGSWEANSPALDTSEVEELAKWFDEIATGGDFEKGLEFLEPCLQFECVERGRDLIHLRIGFGAEFKPPWAGRIQVDTRNAVDFEVSHANLKKASKSLRDELQRFPTRA